MADFKLPRVYKNDNNKYEIRFQYGRGENGAYRYKRISGHTQKEVYKKYGGILTEKRNGKQFFN